MMRIVRLHAIVVVCGFSMAYAQGQPWKISINANLTTTMNSYSDNWVGGEAGSMSWASQFNGTADKVLSLKFLNKNALRLAFGEALLQDKTTKIWAPPKKSTDLIDFSSVLQATLGAVVDPYVSLRLISEFLDGSDSLLTLYLNPADITESAGAARQLVKNSDVDWSARLGAAARQVVDRKKRESDSTVQRKTDATYDGGFEVVSELKTVNKDKWVNYTSLFKLYQAVVSSKAKSLKGTSEQEDWHYPHINWEHILNLNVTKFIMVNVYLQLLYDKEIQENVRFKQTYAVGLTYALTTK